MKTPDKTMENFALVKSELTKMTFVQTVDHPYIKKQFDEFFGAESQKHLARFRSNYMVLVTDKDVAKTIENADKFTLVQSLINLSKDNLSINPYDKEACVVNYGGKIVGYAMAKGKIKRMQETGAIKYIKYLEIVYKSDKITNSNGRYVHERNLDPPNDDKIIGVLLIAAMIDGKERHKFVMTRDIEKRRKHAPSKAIWDKWTVEMYLKTCINIFEKEIGKTILTHSEFIEEEGDEPEHNTTDATYEEVDNKDDSQQQEQESVTEQAEVVSEAVKQDPLLRKDLDDKLKDNPNILTPAEMLSLEEVIDTLPDEKLIAWISAVDKRIEKKNQPADGKNKPMI